MNAKNKHKVNIDSIIPPQAVDLEEAVLGAILLESNCLTILSDLLKPEMFYKDSHSRIYTAIIGLFKQHNPVDMITVTLALKKTGDLELCGGAYFVSSLTDKVVSSLNAEYHARIIQQKYLQRELIRICNDIAKDAYADNDVFETIDKLEKCTTLLSKNFSTGTIQNFTSLIKQMRDHNEVLLDKKGLIGVPCGYYDIDSLTGGFQDSDLIIVAARPAMGKEQPLYSKVLTPYGFKTMGEIKTGDEINGTDGNVYNVTGVYPQGIKPVYEVTFDDNTKVRCGWEHLWEVTDRASRKTKNKKTKVLTLKEIYEQGLYVGNSNRKNFSIRTIKPAVFYSENMPTKTKASIHPYLLGIYLAEGNSNNSTIIISNPELEIGEIIKPLIGCDKMVPLNDNTGWRINGGNMVAKLKDLGLCGLISYEKFIPKEYIYSKDRLMLLQGLLDGDEYIANPNFIEYSTTSPMLRDGVIEIVRSLGGKANYIERMGKYKKDDKTKETRINYRVYISFDSDICPVRTEKHKKRYKNKKKYHSKFITNIELIGQDQCKCIMVDAPDHCYITDGYTITHNTSLVCNMFRNAAVDFKKPGIIFSLEMSSLQIAKRIVSIETSISSHDFNVRGIDFERWVFVEQDCSRLINSKLFIDDTPSISLGEMRSKAREMKRKHNIQWIVVDYLQLMTISDKSQNREQEIASISRGLKGLAKELNIPIVALSQLSRAVESRGGDKRPQLSDLRESGAIEQDADMVIFIHRPEYYGIMEYANGETTSGVAEIIFAKNRKGAIGTEKLKFIANLTKFESLNTIDYGQSGTAIKPNIHFSEPIRDDDPF